MFAIRTVLLAFLCAVSCVVGAAEPSVGFNGWTNIPGVLEGQVSVYGKPSAASTTPPYGYMAYLPKGYDPSSSARWPVVVYLAGAGELYDEVLGYGTDNQPYLTQLRTKCEVHGPFYMMKNHQWDFPCIVIAPQSNKTIRWNSANGIQQMVTYVLANYRVDPNRVYATGLCEGGTGIVNWAAAYPTMAAALMPITTITDPGTTTIPTNLKDMPMWLVHCFSDYAYGRRNTIFLLDRTTEAATGLVSNVMATYPGYYGNLRYACPLDAAGKPANMVGPTVINPAKPALPPKPTDPPIAKCKVTSGSAVITLGTPIGSTLQGLWNGTEAKPFARVWIGNDPTPAIVLGANANTITLTKPYTGTAVGEQTIAVQTPVGTTLTASYLPGTNSWQWIPGQETAPGTRLLTMYWQYDHAIGWVNTWKNGGCWDWLFTKAKNMPPTVAAPATIFAKKDMTSAPVAITIGDFHTAPTGLTLTVVSSNQALLPNAGLALSGSGTTRSLVITPAGGATGTATLTFTVKDPQGLTSTATAQASVVTNLPPLISGFVDATTNSTSGTLSCSISDLETPLSGLTITATPADPSLLSSFDFSVQPDGTCQINATSINGFIGDIDVTLTVKDAGGATTIDTAALQFPNAPPRIGQVVDEVTVVGGSSATISFTLADGESPVTQISASGLSGDPLLIPPSGLVVTGSGTNRTLTVTPAGTAAGQIQIAIVATDPQGGSSAHNILVTMPGDPEPTVGNNGWTNVPLQREGTLTTRAIDDTLPQPPYGYVEYLPKGYDTTGSAAWPVVIFLHGIGEIGPGTNTAANGYQLSQKMSAFGPLYQVAMRGWDFPCVVIAPQTATTWSNMTGMRKLVDYVKTNYSVDPKRIYMAGHGEGASGVMRFATAYPGDLAGILPINTTYMPTAEQATAIKLVPMWAAHCFSNAAYHRRTTIAWIDLTSQASTGMLSNVMATYPGYNGGNMRYACEIDASGKPLYPNGPKITLPSSTVTNGSKTVNLSTAIGSPYFGMWNGSDAKPFAKVWIDGTATPWIAAGSNATSLTLTQPYTGSSGVTTVQVQTPIGRILSATGSGSTWSWNNGQAVNASIKRALTMFWEYDVNEGVLRTSANAVCWNWLFSQVGNLPPQLALPADTLIKQDQPSPPMPIGISDLFSPAEELTLSVASSDQAAIPDSGLALSGSGETRYLVATPTAGFTGNTTITVTGYDPQGLSTTASFQVSVVSNLAPTISNFIDQSTDAITGTLSCNIADLETPVGDLVVAAAAGDPAVVQQMNTTVQPDGTCQVQIKPISGFVGNISVTLTVTDAEGLSADSIAALTFTAVPNTPPTIELVEDAVTISEEPSAIINFHVADAESPAEELTVVATASDATLIPPSALIFAGSGADRTLTITPISNAAGLIQITLTLSDPRGGSVSALIAVTLPCEPEPTVTNNGWSNIELVREGSLTARPVNATTPQPPLGYVEYLPKGYASGTDAWPVVIFAHGMGEIGNGTNDAANGYQLMQRMTAFGPLRQVALRSWDFPCIVIAPQTGSNWGKVANLRSMVDYVKANYRVDANHLYMAGQGEGASGVLRFVTTYPSELAGILLMHATYAPASGQAALIKNLPMWISHCFSSTAYSRNSSIAWIDQASLAETGIASGVMATYPGYNGGSTRYACDVDGSGQPAYPFGPLVAIPNSTATNGSKTVNLGSTLNSIQVGLWNGSDSRSFARVWINNDPAPPWVIAGSNATTLTLTQPYTGITGPSTIQVQTPIGRTLTATGSGTTWTWNDGQAASSATNRILTMFWQYDANEGVVRTSANATCWDWLLSQFKAPGGSG